MEPLLYTSPTTDTRFVAISRAGSLAHPLMFVGVGVAIFCMAWVFPPSLYEYLFDERNRLFLDLKILAYVSSCVFATVLGISITNVLRRSPNELIRPLSDWEKSRLTVVVAMAGCVALNFLAIYTIYKTGALNAFIQTIVTGSLQLVRQQRELLGEDENPLWIALLTPSSLMIPMIYHRARHFPLRDWRLWLFALLLFTFMVAAVLAAKRNIIVRPLFGCMCVYLLFPSTRGLSRLSLQKGVLLAVSLASVVLFLFLGLAYLRNGASGFESSSREVLRYLVCPYNTATALVHRELVFPGAGTGSYWSQFIWKMPGTGDAFAATREYFLGPAAPIGDQQRILFLNAIGIRSGTAITAFGATFVDFGWLGPFAFLMTGIFAGLSWKSLRMGGILGLCFYFAVAYSFVEWRANLLFPAPYFMSHIAIGILAYIGCLLERRGAR